MSKKDSDTKKRPSKLWFFFASLLLSVFIIIQLPVSWIVQKLLPNSPYITWVSGNLWQGTANLQVPSPSVPSSTMNGTLSWQWKPLKVFLGKFHADVDVTFAQTKLNGYLTLGKNSLQLSELSGRIDPATISTLSMIELPDAPIKVNKLTLDFDKKNGFNDADGQLTWVGGKLGFPHDGRIQQINLPNMKANLAVVENKNKKKDDDAKNSLHVHLVNTDNKTLGNFYLDNAGMLDVNLTQRLLENVPGYSGSAPQDTAVVSVRQPITSIGK